MKGEFSGWKWLFRLVQLLWGIFATRQSHKLYEMAFLSEETEKTVSNGACSRDEKKIGQKTEVTRKMIFCWGKKNFNKNCMGLCNSTLIKWNFNASKKCKKNFVFSIHLNDTNFGIGWILLIGIGLLMWASKICEFFLVTASKPRAVAMQNKRLLLWYKPYAD